MDPRLLLQLAVTIDLGSLNRAAKRLNVTQPTLSRSIRILEDRVGAPVLVRESHGVVPTDIGERLAERGRAIFADAEDADALLQQWRDGLTSELRLGVGPLLAATVVPGFAQRALSEKWPYSLKIQCASAAPLIRRLLNDQLDVVLAPAQVRLHTESLTQKVLMKDTLVIVAGALSSLAKETQATRELLEEANWFVTGARAGIHGTEEDVFRALRISTRHRRFSVSGDLSITLHLLRNTDAVTVLPKRLLELMPDLGGASIVDFNVPEIRRDIALWMRKSDTLRTELLHLQDELATHFAKFT